MIVYGALPSPFVRKVVFALEEKGMAYERKDFAPFPKTDELLERSPLGLIPFVEHEGRFVPDSSVICALAERLRPEPSLYPSDAHEFARALFLEEWSDTRLNEVQGGIFFERFVKPHVFEQETDEAAVEQWIADGVPDVLSFLERALDGRETLVGGEGLTIADCAVGAQLAGFALSGVPIDGERWPGVVRYLERLGERDSFRTATDFG